MMQAIKSDSTVRNLPLEEIQVSNQINFRVKPEDSYFFDGLKLDEAEDWLNNVTFYNELIYNIPLGRFMSERVLAEAYVPVATFDHERREQN